MAASSTMTLQPGRFSTEMLELLAKPKWRYGLRLERFESDRSSEG
jgi:hypothetical protein